MIGSMDTERDEDKVDVDLAFIVAIDPDAKAVSVRPVIWNRGGERRLIPAAVIRNAKRMLDSWYEALAAAVITAVPAAAQVIAWDSCLQIPDAWQPVTLGYAEAPGLRVEVELAGEPSVSVGDNSGGDTGDPGDESSPAD